MATKIGLNLKRNYSINFDLPQRSKKLIKFIIIHYTGMKIESKAVKRLLNPKSRVSTHYFIKNDGTIINKFDVKKSIQIAEKLMKGNGRILVRKSGTESKIRIMGESDDKKLLIRCIEIISKKIK